MRVALDYTPAIDQIAGVGRYTRSLFSAMLEAAGNDVDWLLWHTGDRDIDPRFLSIPNVTDYALPLSARWSNLLWHRLGLPLRFERYSGQVSVLHGTDFVVPPSKAPSVVTVHDLSYVMLPHLAFPKLKRYLEQAVPRSINRAARIVAVSETTKDDLCEYYEIAPHRVEVIYHAADPLFNEVSSTDILGAQAQFSLRPPYFIIVGTIEPRKDHSTLLEAFKQVHEQRPEASLVIVGRKGWLADDIMRQIEETARTLPVIHLQGIQDRMLPGLYAGSTALVFPTHYEGFGLPVLEAMASGTAVICSNVRALREVAGDAALYTEPQDPATLAGHMIRLLENSEERDRLLDAGKRRSAQFSWLDAAEKHLRLYRGVSNGR